jgi:hypothetical protein
MGINRNVSRAIVFGPKSLGGLEMHHMYTLQGTKRLQCFLGNIVCNNGNGNFMKICMEHIQLEVGTYEPFLFLKHVYSRKAIMNQSWLTAIWSHLELYKGTITTTNPWLPRPTRVHDVALTSIASEAGLGTAQQFQINKCRI